MTVSADRPRVPRHFVGVIALLLTLLGASRWADSATTTIVGNSAANPVRTDPVGTTPQPVSGTVTANQGTAAAVGAPWPFEQTDGASNIIGTAAHPTRVDPTGTTTQPISAASLPLPTGAATETTLAAMSAKLPASLGSKADAASFSIVPSTTAIFSAAQSGTWTVAQGAAGAAWNVTSTQLPAGLGVLADTAALGVVLGRPQKTLISSIPITGSLVFTGTGVLEWIQFTNTFGAGVLAAIQIHDATSCAAGCTQPAWQAPVALNASSAANLGAPPSGLPMTTGATLVASTTLGNYTAAAGATTIDVTIVYRQ